MTPDDCHPDPGPAASMVENSITCCGTSWFFFSRLIPQAKVEICTKEVFKEPRQYNLGNVFRCTALIGSDVIQGLCLAWLLNVRTAMSLNRDSVNIFLDFALTTQPQGVKSCNLQHKLT